MKLLCLSKSEPYFMMMLLFPSTAEEAGGRGKAAEHQPEMSGETAEYLTHGRSKLVGLLKPMLSVSRQHWAYLSTDCDTIILGAKTLALLLRSYSNKSIKTFPSLAYTFWLIFYIKLYIQGFNSTNIHNETFYFFSDPPSKKNLKILRVIN